VVLEKIVVGSEHRHLDLGDSPEQSGSGEEPQGKSLEGSLMRLLSEGFDDMYFGLHRVQSEECSFRELDHGSSIGGGSFWENDQGLDFRVLFSLLLSLSDQFESSLFVYTGFSVKEQSLASDGNVFDEQDVFGFFFGNKTWELVVTVESDVHD